MATNKPNREKKFRFQIKSYDFGKHSSALAQLNNLQNVSENLMIQAKNLK